ncbi:MAG: GLPGLI family protein [Bernardetiaceae bacterium]
MKYLLYFFLAIPFFSLAQSPISGTLTYTYTTYGLEERYTMHFTAEAAMAYTERSEKYFFSSELVPIPGKENSYDAIVKKTDQESNTYYKNLKEKQLVTREMGTSYRPSIVLEEPLPEIDWQIVEDMQKTIGDFACQAAKGSYKGRRYLAWFTYQIPVSHGPWKFCGLPGLILEIHDDTPQKRFHFVVNTIEIGKTDFPYPIEAPKMGERITWGEYAYMYIHAQEALDKKVKAMEAAKGGGRTLSMILEDYTKSHLEGPAFVAWEKSQK